MKSFSEVQLPGLNVVMPLVFFLCARVSCVSFYSGILYQEVTPFPCVNDILYIVLGLVNLLQRYSEVLSLGKLVQGRFFYFPLV